MDTWVSILDLPDVIEVIKAECPRNVEGLFPAEHPGLNPKDLTPAAVLCASSSTDSQDLMQDKGSGKMTRGQILAPVPGYSHHSCAWPLTWCCLRLNVTASDMAWPAPSPEEHNVTFLNIESTLSPLPTYSLQLSKNCSFPKVHFLVETCIMFDSSSPEYVLCSKAVLLGRCSQYKARTDIHWVPFPSLPTSGDKQKLPPGLGAVGWCGVLPLLQPCPLCRVLPGGWDCCSLN